MTSARRLLDRSVAVLQQSLLVALPHGGQRTARVNAWQEVQEGWSRREARIRAADATRQLEVTCAAEVPVYAYGGR